MSVMSVLLVAVVANSCSDSISPQSVVGLWVEDNSPPGNSLDMSLALNGSAISGQGSWCGEALGCGLTTVTGTATGNRIHLVTTFDSGEVQTFDGTLTSQNSLAGSVVGRSPGGQIQLPHAQSFHRMMGDPPRTQ
jgi:hypothetical protein